MPTPPAFEIYCDPRLISEFRLNAKRRFPKETYAVFLGVVDEPDVVEVVEMLVCPEERLVRSSQWEVVPEESWLTEVETAAEKDDLVVVGDIHSHCSRDEDGFVCQTAPSTGDLKTVGRYQWLFKGHYAFMAVMALHKGRVKIRSSVDFWPAVREIKVNWSKDE